MTELDEKGLATREKQMQIDVLLVATAGASLLNGLPSSPVLFPFVVLLNPLLAGSIFGSPIVLTYLASFLASATTLAIAGVPAALYERAKGLQESSPMSVGIWLAAILAIVGLPYILLPS